jgi:hypothetical protein
LKEILKDESWFQNGLIGFGGYPFSQVTTKKANTFFELSFQA